MNPDIIAKTEHFLDLLLNHEENCEHCCLRDLFKEMFENV